MSLDSRPAEGRERSRPLVGARVAIAYDCLFPWTVGGAERWYRRLADGLVAAGATVTYLTRCQWDGPAPEIPGIEVVAVSDRSDLYDDNGGRRLGPTLRFGAGVARHVLSRRRNFDLVHTASFPFWSVLGLRSALAAADVPLIVDWHEIWSDAYWRDYAGPLTGRAGAVIQRVCLRATEHAVVTSPVNAARFRATGHRRDPLVLAGLIPAVPEGAPPAWPRPDRPFVLFAGRHIRDKGVDLLADVAGGLADLPSPVDLVIAGDGPQRPDIERQLRTRGLSARCVGFVGDEELEELMATAACLLVPSRREGYGMAPVEAARFGTPSVVAAFPENLAVDHIERGHNGVVTAPTPVALTAGVAEVLAGGAPLRATTAAWYERSAASRTIDTAVSQVVDLHAMLLQR